MFGWKRKYKELREDYNILNKAANDLMDESARQQAQITELEEDKRELQQTLYVDRAGSVNESGA